MLCTYHATRPATHRRHQRRRRSPAARRSIRPVPSGAPMIEVHDIRKQYAVASGKPVVAVDGLSFVVKPGEVYGLLGANGAGKTTTLKMLATLIQPDSGSIVVGGVDARK